VNLELLADLAGELGAPEELRAQIRAANTARHVLELCSAAKFGGITSLVCRKVAENCAAHAGAPLEVHAYLVDFNGALLGRYPDAEANVS
jgi:cobalt-precorrin-5B (C1)-methyltransferase